MQHRLLIQAIPYFLKEGLTRLQKTCLNLPPEPTSTLLRVVLSLAGVFENDVSGSNFTWR